MTDLSGKHRDGRISGGWLVVLGSVIGLIVGSGAVKIFAFSVLLKSTAEGADLSRASIGLAFLIGNIAAMLFTPIYGRLIDIFGIRLISIPCALLWAATMAAFALLGPATNLLIYPLYIASGIFGVAQTPIPYSKAITSWFDDKRGLALGIGVSGVGIGGFLMPQYVQYANNAYGWRAAYVAIGVAIAMLAVPAFYFLVRVRPDANTKGRPTASGASRTAIIVAMLGRRHFWTLAIIFFLSISAAQGIVGHMVAMLTDRGISDATAATALSLTGVMVIVGRLACGYLLDKFYPPLIACIFFAISALSCAVLASDVNGVTMMIAAIGIGLGVGAEVDVLGYLTSRYFSLAAYGTIYGVLFSLVALGTSTGPFAVSLVARSHGYDAALMVAASTLVICAVLAITLGPYPQDADVEPSARLADKPEQSS
jgi:MFS family permease